MIITSCIQAYTGHTIKWPYENIEVTTYFLNKDDVPKWIEDDKKIWAESWHTVCGLAISWYTNT